MGADASELDSDLARQVAGYAAVKVAEHFSILFETDDATAERASKLLEHIIESGKVQEDVEQNSESDSS